MIPFPYLPQIIAQPVAGGGGGPGAHQWWRIRINANDGSALYMGMSELVLKNALAVAVQGSSVSASSFINGSNAPNNAIDGNTGSSGWLSATATTGEWIHIDVFTNFGSNQEVKTVEIWGSWNAADASPSDFDVQWSDDNSSWTTAATFTGETGWTASQLRTFNVF
jgi:hypothetical protein